MTRSRRISLICRALLLPYCDPDFGYKDPLLKKTKLYHDFLVRNGTEADLYRRYIQQRDNLIKRICSLHTPDRLDEAQQLLEMFYGDAQLCKVFQDNELPLDEFYIKQIFQVSDSFVTMRDGVPALRTWTNIRRSDLFYGYNNLHKAELWNMITRLSTPDLWIAAYYVIAGIEDIRNLSNIADNLLLSDRMLMKHLSSGIAETHLHFNAGMDYQVLWALISDVTALKHEVTQLDRDGEMLKTLLMAGLLRLFLAAYLLHAEPTEDDDFFTWVYGQLGLADTRGILCRIVCAACAGSKTQQDFACIEYFSNFRACTRELTEFFNVQHQPFRFDLLSRSVFQHLYEMNTSCDILLYYKALWAVKHRKRPQLRRALLQYIRLKNHCFKTITQPEDIHGLRKFRSYYQNAAGAIYRFREEDPRLSYTAGCAIFQSQSRMPHLKLLEIKIVPPLPPSGATLTGAMRNQTLKNELARQLWVVFHSYLHFLRSYVDNKQFPVVGIDATMEEKKPNTLDQLHEKQFLSFPTIGVIYHFTKPDLLRSSFGQTCWADNPQYKANTPHYVETLRAQYGIFCDTLTEMFLEIPYLGEYVVGLDAASEELNAEPWIYAPVFVYARSKHNTWPMNPNTHSAIPNLGLTYHVGEEFRNLYSGLRAIDEVLEYFGFKAGDRLGHAVALQVNPVLWQRENSVTAIPAIEHMENMLWRWSIKNQKPGFEQEYDLELKIMELAQQLYGNTEGITPYHLWKAYQCKFLNSRGLPQNCQRCTRCKAYPHTETCPLSNINTDEGRSTSDINTGEGRSTNNINTGEDRWTEERLLLTYFCPLYQERFRKPIFVPVAAEETDLLMKLQSELRQKAGQLGITIEVNPTSNSAIAAVNGLFEHPILQLNNWGLMRTGEEKRHLAVSINTDDPLVFHTTTENEIAYMYYMLTDMGYCREDVLNWIERIRQFGMNSSFVRQEKQPSVMLYELNIVCETLRQRYLNGHSPIPGITD